MFAMFAIPDMAAPNAGFENGSMVVSDTRVKLILSESRPVVCEDKLDAVFMRFAHADTSTFELCK